MPDLSFAPASRRVHYLSTSSLTTISLGGAVGVRAGAEEEIDCSQREWLAGGLETFYVEYRADALAPELWSNPHALAQVSNSDVAASPGGRRGDAAPCT
jgi:hypothetical protein